MPCDYSIDAKRGLVITVLSGIVTLPEGLEHQVRVMKDPEFSPDFRQIIDSTKAIKIQLDSEEIRQIAQISPFSSNSRRAILANSAFMYGMARMLQSYREIAGGQEMVRIFQDREEMMDWILGV